jgi:hypothetical protein
MADYLENGYQYSSAVVGPTNAYGVFMSVAGTLKIVRTPFGATQIECMSFDTSGNLTATGRESRTYTATSATPGTLRTLYGKIVSYTTMTSGNLVGVRGEVTLGGSVSTGCFLYGVQGKVIYGANTVAAGSGAVCGVYGQLDVSGATLTSGYNCALSANIYGHNSGTATALWGIYVEAAGGGVITSYIRCFGKAVYVLDLESNVHADVMKTSGSNGSVGAGGYLKINVEGSTRYIFLSSTAS